MAERGEVDEAVLQAGIAEPSQGGSGPKLLLAGRIGVGLAYAYGEASWVALEADVQPALHSAASEVQRHAVLNARLGVFHELATGVALGAGLFTDRSADEPNSDAMSARGDYYGGTVGLELSSAHRLARDEPVDSLVFSSVFAVRYAFSDGTVNGLLGDPDVSNGNWFTTREVSLRVHEIGLYVGSGLRF